MPSVTGSGLKMAVIEYQTGVINFKIMQVTIPDYAYALHTKKVTISHNTSDPSSRTLTSKEKTIPATCMRIRMIH